MFIANIIALVLVLLGAINWGLVGIFNWDLVAAIFGGTVFASIVYIIIFIAAIWLIVDLCLEHGRISLRRDRD